MSNLMKMPHEISLWDDILTVVDIDGNEHSGLIDLSEIKVAAQYYKEKKLCVISTDKMESPTYALEPALARKTDGTSTLTFSIYAKYLDEESGEFRDNPFIQYLTNERKVKLKYYPNGELKWLDFIIKKIDESSENHKFTYTAIDLFVNELSKTGYNLEFNMELENNQGPIDELAEKILRGTDWSVGADSELLQQTTTEALYKIKLTTPIVAYKVDPKDRDGAEQRVYIDEGQEIYTFYSTITEGNYDYFQFIYNEKGQYTIDENGVLHAPEFYYTIIANKDFPPYDKPEYVNDFRGERYVRSPKSLYDDIVKRYVKVYRDDTNNKEVYGYTENKYISAALVNNFITNGNNITTKAGWLQQKAAELEVKMFPTYEEIKNYKTRFFALEYTQETGNGFTVNSGFRDSAAKIGKIASGDRFVFRIKGGKPIKKDDITVGLALDQGNFKVEVDSYTFGKNSEIIKNNKPVFSGSAKEIDDEGFYFVTMSVNYPISYEELIDTSEKRFGIFVSVEDGSGGTYYIQEVELFALVTDENERIILPNGSTMDSNGKNISQELKAYVNTTYYYYYPDSSKTDASQIEYLYIGKQELDVFRPLYVANFEKIRGITAKETNRFNLLQSLSETFECWCRFDVLHMPDGKIALRKDIYQTQVNSGGVNIIGDRIYDGQGPSLAEAEVNIIANQTKIVQDAYRQQKFVTFHERIGQKKDIGFVYGINLKSISRTLDSNDIATKLIVKSNNNKYATAGSCNIARAENNPSKENFILDFSHYIKQGLLSYSNVQNDLYYQGSDNPDEDRKWIGLFFKLKASNKERDKLIVKQSALAAELSTHKSNYESSKMLREKTEDRLREQEEYYYELTSYEYGEIEKLEEGNQAKEWLNNETVIATAIDIERLKVEKAQHVANEATAEDGLAKVEAELKVIEQDLDKLRKSNEALLNDFEKKYSRFIQEASWISEDYTDDNLYYFDAESTLHNAAQPKVTYTINVVELSQLEEYKGYSFDLGDITYVQDPDFFGWDYVKNREFSDEIPLKTPHKEEIVITEMTTFFNSPEKNSLKAKNYRDSFEDLFQRMAASSQQLQFHSGAYDRASDAVNSEGNIVPQALSDAFAHNAYVLSNIANQSVRWDEYGITTTDTTNPADIVRITSGGIYLTEDGGDTWTTGISASGINAKNIVTGQLNTGKITIMNGKQTAFRWDDKGINAFKEVEQIVPGKEEGEPSTTKTVRSTKTYVRFDEHGLYGIDGKANFDPKDDSTGKTGIEKINDEAKFALTWDGFVLNSSSDDNTAKIKISDKKDFQIFDKEQNEVLKIGRLTGQNSVGMQVNVEKDGTKPVIIGDTGFRDGEHGKLVFRAGGGFGETDDNAPFRVYEDGFFYAKTGQIGGSLTAAQLRDIKIEVSYISDMNGTSAILTCSPTIAQDEINSVSWKIGDNSYNDGDNNDLSLKVSYDAVKGLYNTIPEKLLITASAWVSKFEAEDSMTDDDDLAENFERELELPLDNIFKTTIEYVNSEDGVNVPATGWSEEIPSFEPGKYRWTKYSNNYLNREEPARYEVIYYGKDGKSVQDLNLKASSYIFVQDKDGKVSENQKIDFVVEVQNISGGKFKWLGVDEDGDQVDNTASLSYSSELFVNGQGHVVTVQYIDADSNEVLFEDSITILLVKDGSDALSVGLTNSTLTFTAGIDRLEETQVLVYYGSTQIYYSAEDSSGWRYTIDCPEAIVKSDGIIEVSNPNIGKTIEATITVYKDNQEYRVQKMYINCLVSDSLYFIELTNDGATIGVDENGSYDSNSLKLITETEVSVHRGTIDITNECTFEWQSNGCELSSYRDKKIHLTSLIEGYTTASAIVTVIQNEKTIGTKIFTIATVEAGAAVSYKLNISPNTVNLTDKESESVELEVLKITGGTIEKIASNYKIYVNGINKELITSYSVSETSIFDLYIGENKWDTETVSIVRDGRKGIVQDLDLTADSYVFIKDKEGKIKSPNNITLTAVVKGLTGGKIKWSGTSNDSSSNSINSLTQDTFGTADSRTVKVQYLDENGEVLFEDSLTILAVQDGPEGEAAVSVALTNPTMTFNASGANDTETSEAIVYYGATKIYYGASNAVNGWYYTLSENHSKVSINSSTGVITVTNPGTVKIPIYLTLYKGDGTSSSHTLYINCSTVSNGLPGLTIQTVSAYYRSANFSTPTKPTDYSSTLPSGWSTTPQSLTDTYKYQYISQCTVTDSVYGTWTSPVLFARYGSDGNDATVTALNIYNAVTNNGTEQGCFTHTDGKLYINAEFINTGILRVGDSDSEIFFADMGSQIVGIGGFRVGKTRLTGAIKEAIYYGLVKNSDNLTNDVNVDSMIICPKGMLYSRELAGQTGLTWKMAVGTKFGVTNSGALYATEANISGTITNTNTDALGNPQTVSLKNGYMECSQKINNTTYKRIASGPYDLYTTDNNTIGFQVGYSTSLSNTAFVGFSTTYIKFLSNEAQLFGTWKGTSSQAISSDRSKKNTIKVLAEPYEALYDNLIPVTYKYNDGLSGRTHTGFIAQEVAQALAMAGISTKDFAGYIVANEFNSETGEEEEVCYLRYEEFISLNTWQIQKLKPRMTAAEQEIEKLKLEIEQLRAELNSLK